MPDLTQPYGTYQDSIGNTFIYQGGNYYRNTPPYAQVNTPLPVPPGPNYGYFTFTSRILTNADDGATLVCNTSQTATVNAGLEIGFGPIFKGTIAFTAGAGVTVNDLRASGSANPYCGLVQTAVDTYDVIGVKA